MRCRKTVFCEIAFWDKFSECYPVSMPFPDDQSLMFMKAWIELYSFLSRSNIVLDTDEAGFLEKTNKDERLKLLWKKATGGYCKIGFNKDTFHSIKDAPSFHKSVILTKDNYEREYAQFGVININASNFYNKGLLYIDNGVAIHSGEKWDWIRIKDHIAEMGSNAMVVVDNYVFGSDYAPVQDNIYRLLDSILPESCSSPYHLSIFYVNGTDNNQTGFINEIKRIRPNLDLKLEFFRTAASDFHDRAIITNNMWIGSGAGFSICKSRQGVQPEYLSKKSTTVTIAYPFFSSNNVKPVDDGYVNLIMDAKKALRIRGLSSSNRLLL